MSSSRLRLAALIALFVSTIASPVLAADVSSWPAWVPRGARLSAAYERMLRDQIAEGRVLPRAIVERHRLDVPIDELDASAPADRTRVGSESIAGPGVAMLPDALANNRAPDVTCAACSFRPLSQSETTIAALGSNLLAGWNNSRGFCTGLAIQAYGYSVDGGATWVDAGDPPALPTGGRYRGDPVHAVNAKTGDFYILGLYEGGNPGSGIALARGHFAGGAFVIDDNRQVASGGSNFIDKEWMAVDSTNGYLYVTYSNFLFGNTSRIELIRSRDNGLTWDLPAVILNAPAQDGFVQGSRPVVGPAGEVYVVWYEQDFPQSHMRIRRSDDHGSTFGPERTVCDFYENFFSGAPGFRRPGDVGLPGLAIDRSNGPHRGRVYVTWDESVAFFDAPFPGSPTSRSESEKNDFFVRATPFAIGDLLRGTFSTSADVDLFAFSGIQGQTIYVVTDSATVSTSTTMRLVCGADTTSFVTLRSLAFNQATQPALAFTLPANGTYYLRLNATSGLATYRIKTTLDTPTPGERARDHRDRFISHSDDGTTWSTPARLNDDPPYFDGEFPEVTVDGHGDVHAFWHDFRDDAACGADSYEYMTSSGDGGVTWGANRRVSDAISFWSTNACGSANQGDYQGITSEGFTVQLAWADSRNGDPDVFVDRPRFHGAVTCPSSILAPAGSHPTLDFAIANQGNVSGSFHWMVQDDTHWLASVVPSINGFVGLAAGGNQPVQATFNVPSQCTPTSDEVRFIVEDLAIPGRVDTCRVTISCVSNTGVGPVSSMLGLDPPQPNPGPGRARLGFSLSRHGEARLEIFGAGGARIRTLASETLAPGAHARTWDGTDTRGRRVGPGVYYVRLTAEGRRLERPLVLVR
jgi:hypothetical protein